MVAPSPIVILGPTAGGKSELAVDLAERVGGEIVSADSMQVYRHLDAGTAKPGPELRQRAVHHLIDVVEPTEAFTAADWLARADELIASLAARGPRAIVVGGTNLYIKLLLEGMLQGPGRDEDLRRGLEELPADELHARLARVDPASAGRIHRQDRKRLVRALEVHALTGEPISRRQAQWADADDADAARYRHDARLIGLHWPTEAINRRINARVKAMFEPAPGVESLPAEVRRLNAAGLLGPQAREALGYKQVLAALAGKMTLADAMERTKVLTRRFAKQQRTWLKRFRGVTWIDAGEIESGRWLDAALAAATTEMPGP
ncbi:MAG: tRNA (adenosine(37)-N6)-dimethylallyltransferase MiaA [Phycisphaeraceae bacterium]